ncbi:MAG: hypothetical protein ACJA1C_002940 [Crocinitomicaceae bacterium]|jgi:hypothetical protein
MKILFVIAIISLAFVSCKKEGCTDPTAINYSEEAKKDDGSCTFEAVPAPEPALTLIGTATTSTNETVKVYAEEALSTGYSGIYTEVTDDNGVIVDDATVTYAPLMDMGTMQHACPVIQPTFDAIENQYRGVVIFQMASMAGTWTLDVIVNGNPVSFDITVAESATKVVGVYTGDDTEQYIISVVRPENWIVGMNNLDITLYRMETMMSFPEVTDMDIVLTPEMMSMGHGSTGNISPVHVANGLYSGTVNLSMAGDWRLHLELIKNSVLVHSDAFLDILF